MKRYSALVSYSRFHRSVLFLALLAKKNGPPLKDYPSSLTGKWDYAIHFWDEELCLHFEKEEHCIWSRLVGRQEALDHWIELMRKQQQKIEGIFSKMSASEANEEILHELGVQLEEHIRTKERKVFQHIQSLFKEEELLELID